MLRPDASSLLALLWGVWTRQPRLFTPPQAGLTSFIDDGDLPAPFLAAAGFRAVGKRAIRLDMLERLEDELEKGAAAGANAEVLLPKLVSLIGSSNDELKATLAQLGWHIVDVADTGNGVTQVWRKQAVKTPRPEKHRRDRREPSQPKIVVNPNSPFAGLAALLRK
jgi:ATP-dependent RNA helicase SUPV3L1/SUV3